MPQNTRRTTGYEDAYTRMMDLWVPEDLKDQLRVLIGSRLNLYNLFYELDLLVLPAVPEGALGVPHTLSYIQQVYEDHAIHIHDNPHRFEGRRQRGLNLATSIIDGFENSDYLDNAPIVLSTSSSTISGIYGLLRGSKYEDRIFLQDRDNITSHDVPKLRDYFEGQRKKVLSNLTATGE